MEPKRKRILLGVLFILAIGNYSRLEGTANIRNVEFLSIFAIGMLSGLIIREIAVALKHKWLV